MSVKTARPPKSKRTSQKPSSEPSLATKPSPAAKPSLKPYIAKIRRLEELQGQTGHVLFERTKLLCELFDDWDFRQHVNALDDAQLGEFLTHKYLADLGVDFFQVRTAYEHFPAPAPWQERGLFRLIQEAQERNRKPAKGDEQPTRKPGTRATRQQVEAAERRAAQAEARLAAVRDASRKAAQARASGNGKIHDNGNAGDSRIVSAPVSSEPRDTSVGVRRFIGWLDATIAAWEDCAEIADCPEAIERVKKIHELAEITLQRAGELAQV